MKHVLVSSFSCCAATSLSGSDSITEHADNISYLSASGILTEVKAPMSPPVQELLLFQSSARESVETSDLRRSSFDLNIRQLTQQEIESVPAVPWSTEPRILKLKTLLPAATASLQINCTHYICLQQFV